MIVAILETLDHDMALVNGDLFLCSDERVVSQLVEARLRLFLGEWFLDLREGIPYFEQVFIKNPDMTVVRSLLSKVVTDTPGVKDLLEASFTFDREERILYYDIRILSDLDAEFSLNGPFILKDFGGG